MSKIICIDAGHGGRDAGAVLGNRHEKRDNLNMATAIGNILKQRGHTVFYTRTADMYMDLDERPLYANKVKADYFISVHRNSASASAYGVEAWVYSKSDAKTKQMAQHIIDAICKVYPRKDNKGIGNRGVKTGYTGAPTKDYSVNRNSKMPSCLLELLFISNPNDNAIYDKYFDKLAIAVADGICKALGEPTSTTPPQASDKMFYQIVWQLPNADIAVKVCNCLNGAKSYAERNGNRVVSYSYSDKARAEDICKAIELMLGVTGEVKIK